MMTAKMVRISGKVALAENMATISIAYGCQ